MFEFILADVLMISSGVVLYVIARALPRVDINQTDDKVKSGAFERWITSGVPEKADAILNSFMFKFLRKLKVSLLKIDNLVGKKLDKIKSKNGGETLSSGGFSGINGKDEDQSVVAKDKEE